MTKLFKKKTLVKALKMDKIVFDWHRLFCLFVFFCFFVHFREIQESTFSEALRQVKKQNFKVKLWNWGPIQICAQLAACPFFFSSKIPPPYCSAALVTAASAMLAWSISLSLSCYSEDQAFLF